MDFVKNITMYNSKKKQESKSLVKKGGLFE